MLNQTNSEDEPQKKPYELSKFSGHSSEEFARKALLNNDYVANYLIGFLGEGDLRLLQETEYLQNIMNALIALKWQLFHHINFEFSYAKLHDSNPNTQQEFDTLLKELFEEIQN